MKKILWLSRHVMTDDQLQDLFRIYGEVQVITYFQSVTSWKDVVTAGEDCDILAVVLPPAILGDLLNPRNNSKPVIRAVANRVATGNTVVNPASGAEETEYRFQHIAWEQIKKIEIITERL